MKLKFVMMLAATVTLAACECKDGPTTDASGVGAGVGTGEMAEAFAAQTNHKVYFGFDKSTLTPAAQKDLWSQYEWLKEHSSIDVEIQGYCDERGPVAYNDKLGLRRANAAKAHLESLGMESSRIKTVTFGNRVTLVPGHDEEAWSQNRVAITIVK